MKQLRGHDATNIGDAHEYILYKLMIKRDWQFIRVYKDISASEAYSKSPEVRYRMGYAGGVHTYI